MKYLDAGADISACGRYRYALWRRWDDRAPVHFIGLNPSTADAHADDPTIRRMAGFAGAYGAGGIVVTNLCALRATDPGELYARLAAEGIVVSIGGTNSVRDQAKRSAGDARVIVCWGALRGTLAKTVGIWLAEWARVDARPLWCLGTTKGGHPRHPLYLRADAKPVRFEVAR